MEKEFELIMLPTDNKKVSEGQLVLGAYKHLFTSRETEDIGILEAQHLYVLSDEKIEVGDFYYSEGINSVYQAVVFPLSCKDAKKIIVSTDENLGLPNIFTTFLKYFADEYNNGNVINKVTIESEFERLIVCQGYVNVRPIKKQKETWTKEEVIEEKYELMSLFFTQHYNQLSNIDMSSEYIRKWVKNNI